MMRLSLCIAFTLILAVTSVNGSPWDYNATVEDLVRLRCSLNSGDEAVLTWEGTVTSFGMNEPQRLLFSIVGFNVARCFKNHDGSFTLASREMMLYLNVSTNEKLLFWQNPWTGQRVDVVHVANDPVQNPFPNILYPVHMDSDAVMLTSNVPLYYPNPLYGNATLRPYSPFEMYSGEEFFSFQVSTKEFRETNRPYIPNLHFTWTRQSQFEPWMNMGTRAGGLNYNAQGRRIPKSSMLPQILLRELQRSPLYQHAPSCVLNTSDVTSWTYFASNFVSYLSGAEFPIPIAKEPASCA
jgi:hypothetical protein